MRTARIAAAAALALTVWGVAAAPAPAETGLFGPSAEEQVRLRQALSRLLALTTWLMPSSKKLKTTSNLLSCCGGPALAGLLHKYTSADQGMALIWIQTTRGLAPASVRLEQMNLKVLMIYGQA